MLAQRVLGAVFVVMATALFVYLGGIPFFTFVTAISLLAVHEFSRMLHQGGFRPLTPMSMALALVFFLDAQFGLSIGRWAAAAATLVPLLWLVMRGKQPVEAVVGWALGPAAALYVALPLSHLVLLRNVQDGRDWAGLTAGLWWVVLLLLGTWASDTAAYFVGSAFGRHRFMSHISKHKTLEGLLGGLALCTLVVLAFGTTVLGLVWWHTVLLGMAIGGAAVLGDLAESMVKRATGVKDAGTIIPGHGGMLDRVDSLILTVLVTYYYAVWLAA
ncbi:MAG: phosphatidate cytidylyltransferase [Chloroflexi bacterium]|nr:phosphatidate cytidylyltransferase [Chloroflexota bacterium]